MNVNTTQQSTQCPPDDAIDFPTTVFRMLKTKELMTEYFLSFEEEGRAPSISSPKYCESTGLSVFTSLEGAKHHMMLFGDKPFIAEGTLSDEDGKGKKTPSKRAPSHLTWWPAEGLDRTAKFKCL